MPFSLPLVEGGTLHMTMHTSTDKIHSQAQPAAIAWLVHQAEGKQPCAVAHTHMIKKTGQRQTTLQMHFFKQQGPQPPATSALSDSGRP
jgi:hypothetical protein